MKFFIFLQIEKTTQLKKITNNKSYIMKITITKFSKNKNYLFSLFVFTSLSIFCSLSAYSQIDYYYGLNKKGFRVGIGGGATILQSNWSDNPVGGAGILKLDYDFNPYLSIGIEGQYGMLSGVDAGHRLYYPKVIDTYFTGNINFRIALGEITHFDSSNGWSDAVKAIYLGSGAGFINTSVKLYDHDTNRSNDNSSAKLQKGAKEHSGGYIASSAGFIVIPVNLGTNIALPGLFGNDKVVLNPNFQYNFVNSPLFDGYQPNTNPANGPVSGNQAYKIFSLTLKYKL